MHVCFPCFHWHSMLYMSWRIWSTNFTGVCYFKFNTYTWLLSFNSRFVTCICEVQGSNLGQDTSQLLLSQYWTSQHKPYLLYCGYTNVIVACDNYVFTASSPMNSWFKIWLLSLWYFGCNGEGTMFLSHPAIISVHIPWLVFVVYDACGSYVKC